MFGFSSISEVPFSGFVAVGDVWNEIRNNSDQWIDLAVVVGDVWNEVGNSSDEWVDLAVVEGPVPSLSLNFLTGTYEVVLTLVDYDSIWQSASSNSNSWVEV